MAKAFFITTPIYYVNDVPHLGHAYPTVAADALARFKRLEGREVFLLTGTDEHGQKVEKAAREYGETPIQLADRVVNRYKDLWTRLQITHDRFIRTTEPHHRHAVQAIYRAVQANGDIYLGEYEDWYCTPCETFWTEKELVEGRCPSCGRPVERLKEASYFFRMSKYEEPLRRHIEAHPEFIQPASRRNEILGFLKEGLRDLSISRTTFAWGIPVPDDPRHVIYVWFDALTNYLSAAGYPDAPGELARLWPADVHIIGKDILRFHAVYWPTFLMAARLALPEAVFAHGWWTVEGQKMSKSLGNVVEPGALVEEFGVDAVRYFLLREVPFGQDGDFSRTAFVHRLNGELANDLGNLLNRTLTMVQRYLQGRVARPEAPGPLDEELRDTAAEAVRGYRTAMAELGFSRGLQSLWPLVNLANKYVDENAPWTLAKEPAKASRLRTVLYHALEALRITAICLSPVMPGAAEKMWQQLGLQGSSVVGGETLGGHRLADAEQWGRFPEGTVVGRPSPLFPRVEG
ncbi:MAG: methionine--tRNA ligase [Deltaproteobacteria bacterium]|nr:methionine--tRNA ligase [Deltaproteobacteria bacterium]